MQPLHTVYHLRWLLGTDKQGNPTRSMLSYLPKAHFLDAAMARKFRDKYAERLPTDCAYYAHEAVYESRSAVCESVEEALAQL